VYNGVYNRVKKNSSVCEDDFFTQLEICLREEFDIPHLIDYLKKKYKLDNTGLIDLFQDLSAAIASRFRRQGGHFERHSEGKSEGDFERHNDEQSEGHNEYSEEKRVPKVVKVDHDEKTSEISLPVETKEEPESPMSHLNKNKNSFDEKEDSTSKSVRVFDESCSKANEMFVEDQNGNELTAKPTELGYSSEKDSSYADGQSSMENID